MVSRELFNVLTKALSKSVPSLFTVRAKPKDTVSGIFLALAISRFIPHPPNFTSLIALSFYVPVFLGITYIPYLIGKLQN